MLPASVNVNEPSDRIEYVLDTDTTTAYQRNRPSTLARLANVGATLVTSNRRDFERIPGLRIDDWNVT